MTAAAVGSSGWWGARGGVDGGGESRSLRAGRVEDDVDETAVHARCQPTDLDQRAPGPRVAHRKRIDISLIQHGDLGAGIVQEADGTNAAVGEADADGMAPTLRV